MGSGPTARGERRLDVCEPGGLYRADDFVYWGFSGAAWTTWPASRASAKRSSTTRRSSMVIEDHLHLASLTLERTAFPFTRRSPSRDRSVTRATHCACAIPVSAWSAPALRTSASAGLWAGFLDPRARAGLGSRRRSRDRRLPDRGRAAGAPLRPVAPVGTNLHRWVHHALSIRSAARGYCSTATAAGPRSDRCHSTSSLTPHRGSCRSRSTSRHTPTPGSRRGPPGAMRAL